MRNSRKWHAIAVGAAAVLTLGACAGDDDARTNTASVEVEQASDVAAFCDAMSNVGVGLSIGEGNEGIDPKLAAAEASAPDEIKTDVTTMAEENRAQVAAGEPADGAPPAIPEDGFFAAATSVGDYMADNCGYRVIDVTATDHAFTGIPADALAGKSLIRLTNDGTEYHEVVVERIKNNETRSVEEILALPDEQEGDLFDYRGSAFAPPGLSSWAVVDLSAGRHAALDFIPTGATTPDALLSDGLDTAQRHTGQGMFAEVQVS